MATSLSAPFSNHLSSNSLFCVALARESSSDFVMIILIHNVRLLHNFIKIGWILTCCRLFQARHQGLCRRNNGFRLGLWLCSFFSTCGLVFSSYSLIFYQGFLLYNLVLRKRAALDILLISDCGGRHIQLCRKLGLHLGVWLLDGFATHGLL